ncbi:MAG TPA: hypothetical protein VLA05_01460 [Coriobacteriia bacterium]|nr:hypothetical protein [Coriobacteriia bacterium]
MRYSSEVTVSLPRESVLGLLADRRNDVKWRPGLTLCESIVGEPGSLGSETRLMYRDADGAVHERMEHVESNRLPDAIEYSLTSPRMVEHQLHRFVEGQTETRWIIESTVTFHRAGLAVRRQSALLEPETVRSMQSFKVFAEGSSAPGRRDSGLLGASAEG